MTPAEPEKSAERPNQASETSVTNRGMLSDPFLASSKIRSESNADGVATELYSMHYRSLVQLAELLVWDTPTAEEVVQDSFVAMHVNWRQLGDAGKALVYLRQAVVNRSRSVLRRRTVADKNLQEPPLEMPSAEHEALALLERQALVAALRMLPTRQREAIVLRYYADLSIADSAIAMGITPSTLRSLIAHGMTILRRTLES